MTTAPEPDFVKKSLSAHAAIGLLASALLYLVCLTGTLAVFYAEWQRIEQQDAPEMQEIAPRAVQTAVENVFAREADEPASAHVYVHLPASDLPRTTITTDHGAVHVNADGSLAEAEEIAWSDFLVNIHYTLNLPALVGITIVGVLGVMMLALSLSGVCAHPRIFRDAFRLRARNRQGVGLADWHNRLSVWTLPFSIAIALTGALIGLATVTAYGLGWFQYGGDVQAVYAPIFGEEAKADDRPAPLPDLVPVLDHMASNYPDVQPTYLILHDPETRGQHVQVIAEHDRRLIFGEYYDFDAHGRFHGTAGLSDGDWGQQAAASTYKLHFGNYGGLGVKLAYFALGLALTVICATGVHIWLGKRWRRGHAEPQLAALWDAAVWGVPIALCATLLARYLVGNSAPFATIFWAALAMTLVAALVFAKARYFVPALQYLLVAMVAGTALTAIA